MKYLIVALFVLLILASEETWRHMPNEHSDVPIITWVTDNNPARAEQIRLFQDWITKVGGPPCKLVLDVSNDDDTKKIIQSVSGVGSDVMDVGGSVSYFQAIGFLADVTDVAKELHYDLSHTYPAIAPDLCVRDAQGQQRQFLFPCNVNPMMGMVNCGAFKQFHQPIPPSRWTLAEFEEGGKAFVKAANLPGQARDHYYCEVPDISVLRESVGVAEFDETQTHCTLDDPRYSQILRLIQHWREIHIVPTRADEASFSNGATASYGGTAGYLFNSGNYAILWSGRHLVIQFREDNKGRAARGEPPLELAVVEPPNGGFPVTSIGTRAAGVYEASKHLRMAEYFQAFLASDEYNLQIVRDGDGLPPDPKWTRTEAFLHPPQDPARGVYKQTEWNFHGPFAASAQEIAIDESGSPFVLNAIVDREDGAARELFLETGELSAEDAVHRAAQRINDEIHRTLDENPALQMEYDALCQQQKQIDDLKAAGKKVPLKLIIDPYRRAYMAANGMTE